MESTSQTRFSVVIPTIGRENLPRTVESARWADEVIVVWDAERPEPVEGADVVASTHTGGGWGADQRTLGMSLATGSHISFMDDDDVYTPDAGEIIRRGVEEDPDRVHVFRMMTGGGPIPTGGTRCISAVRTGNIGTPCMVVPNDDRVGEWSQRYEQDGDFYESTIAKHDQHPILHEGVICIVRALPDPS